MKIRVALLSILLAVPIFSFAQDAPKKTAYFFYLDTCPHCHNVDDYFTQNGIYGKYDIVKLDASAGKNGELLMKLYEANGYPEEQRGGVPVVAFGDKFLIGDKPIIDNFEKEIEVSDKAYQLPDPNGADISGLVVHDGLISKTSAKSETAQTADNTVQAADPGQKKSYAPLIIGALVILGAGAMIFFNRET
ncbi:MAG: hypothetical protein PHF35_02285 [Candidatus Moranbacteria bacterium]|nr:hypothetical protein [Candidatus Moranbacteria bacterium]